MQPKTIPEPWLSFLKELDDTLKDEFRFQCMGGFVVTLLYGLPRPTADIDVLSIVTTDVRFEELIRLGGRGSALQKKYGIYLDCVSVVTVPDSYDERLTEMFPGVLRKCAHIWDDQSAKT